jgi:hypothetical protein
MPVPRPHLRLNFIYLPHLRHWYNDYFIRLYGFLGSITPKILAEIKIFQVALDGVGRYSYSRSWLLRFSFGGWSRHSSSSNSNFFPHSGQRAFFFPVYGFSSRQLRQ